MADQMMRVGARGADGTAKPVRSDNAGNIGTQLSARNELVTHAVGIVPAKGTKSVILRYSEFKNYSAIVVALTLPSSISTKIFGNWYIQKPGETNGLQVSADTLMETSTVQRFSSGYLEIRGTQLSIVVANNSDVETEATVYIMGIR